MIGQTLGHYRIVEMIGSGGMGVVYRARDERLDRDVAIKLIPAGTLGDEAARKRFRKEALALVPLLHHLPPPDGLWHISIDRFSPYFTQPEAFGIRNLRPLGAYHEFLSPKADVRRVAYHFMGEYQSGAHQRFGLIQRLHRAVGRWQAAWATNENGPAEELRISRSGGDYLLTDTRRVTGRKKTRRLDEIEAAALLRPRASAGAAQEIRAVQEKLAVVVDGWFVPLAVAEPALFVELGEAPPSAEIFRQAALPVLGQSCAP